MWKVNDPIWGSISFHESVEDSVKAVIATKFFQRLRYTTQLGLAQLVYPSANHTRFSHSLGVAYLADQLATNLHLDKNERHVLVLAALLHDLGHPPFSHSFMRGIAEKIDQLKTRGLFQGLSKSHDDKSWAKQINDCLDTIDDFEPKGVRVKEVLELLDGKHALSPLLNADIDLDRMDYLCRDSLLCGLPYSADATYLINNIILDNGQIVFKQSATTACEGLLFARLQMTKAVYQHPLVKSYEDCFEMIIEKIMSEKIPLCEASAPGFFAACMKQDVDEREVCREFLKLTEAGLWMYFLALSKQTLNTEVANLSECLVNRSLESPSLGKAKITFYKNSTNIKTDSGVKNIRDVSEAIMRMCIDLETEGKKIRNEGGKH
jgi:HD superfamily phosphohydrolase